MGSHGREEHEQTPDTMGCSCVGLYLPVRAEEIEPRFLFRFSVCARSFFKYFYIGCTQLNLYQKAKGWRFSDNCSDKVCVVCTGPNTMIM